MTASSPLTKSSPDLPTNDNPAQIYSLTTLSARALLF
jgi:hypothetical protein